MNSKTRNLQMLDELEEWFDDNIPQDVLDSPGWQPRLLPELSNLRIDYKYEDIIEDDT